MSNDSFALRSVVAPEGGAGATTILVVKEMTILKNC